MKIHLCKSLYCCWLCLWGCLSAQGQIPMRKVFNQLAQQEPILYDYELNKRGQVSNRTNQRTLLTEANPEFGLLSFEEWGADNSILRVKICSLRNHSRQQLFIVIKQQFSELEASSEFQIWAKKSKRWQPQQAEFELIDFRKLALAELSDCPPSAQKGLLGLAGLFEFEPIGLSLRFGCFTEAAQSSCQLQQQEQNGEVALCELLRCAQFPRYEWVFDQQLAKFVPVNSR